VAIPLTHYWTSPNGNRATTRYIAFHHAAYLYAVGDAVRSIYTYHRAKWPLYNAAGYHVICQQDADGIHAYLVNPPEMQGAGVANRNHECYHVCAATNFTGLPSAAWLDASAQALVEAKRRYPDAIIVGHKEIALPGYLTACPGPLWSTWKSQLLSRVDRLLGTPPPSAAAITADSAIVAPARCTEAQALKYMLSRAHTKYTEADIRQTIVPAYFHVCAQGGVDPCVAIAQMIHETGNLSSFWSERPQRNPAGLGVTGETRKARPPTGAPHWVWDGTRRLWAYGLSFPTWASHAIPAHVGRLLAYAVKPGDRTRAQAALIDQALDERALPGHYHGIAPTLRKLGGTWAVPGTTYGAKVAAIAETIRTTKEDR
jgi:hypothetical protein